MSKLAQSFMIYFNLLHTNVQKYKKYKKGYLGIHCTKTDSIRHPGFWSTHQKIRQTHNKAHKSVNAERQNSLHLRNKVQNSKVTKLLLLHSWQYKTKSKLYFHEFYNLIKLNTVYPLKKEKQMPRRQTNTAI